MLSGKGKTGAIQRKIVRLVLSISLLALLTSALVSFVSIQLARSRMIESSADLGSTAAADSEQALIEQAKENLITEATAKAELTDQRLQSIQEQVELLASYVGPVYDGTVAINDSREGRDGDWVMQYGAVSDVSDAQLADEIARTEHAFYVLQPLCRQNQEEISSVYFASESGFMLSYDPNSTDEYQQLFDEGYDPRQRDWYINALAEDGTVFTETYLDVFGRLLVTCASPVKTQAGKTVGVLGMDILIEDINESIVNAEVGEEGYAFLIDQNGIIISAPNLEVGPDGNYKQVKLGEKRGFSAVVEAMLAGESGFLEAQAEEPLFVSYAPVPVSGWSLGMVLPREEVVAPAAAMYDHIITETGETTGAVSSMTAIMLVFFALAIVVIVVIVMIATRVQSRRLTDPIRTLTQGAQTIGAGNLDHEIDVNTGDELEILGDTINHMTVSLKEYMTNLEAITADRERIAAELGVAATIQTSMLPCIFPAFPEREEFNIFADMHPAKKVGGDFYDFFLTDPDHLWVVIADVSGKGVPAALFMVIAKTLIKNQAGFCGDPGEVLGVVNNQLCENNDAGMFVTCFVGVLDIPTGKFTFANAGHNAPLLYRAGGNYEWLKVKPGFVLAGLDNMQFVSETLTMRRGDRLYLYTDGVTEALNPAEELYGDDRLLATMNREDVKNQPIEQVVGLVQEDIHVYADGTEQADDITMLLLEIN